MAIKAIASASGVGLITMPTAALEDYFNGGRAVERLWLYVTACQMAFQPMTVLPYLFARLLRGSGEGLDSDTCTELRQLRSRYMQLFHVTDTTAEIMLFRVGYADPPLTRSLRRECKEVLCFASY